MKTIKAGEIPPYGFFWREHPYDGRKLVLRLPLWAKHGIEYMVCTDTKIKGKWRRFVVVTFQRTPYYFEIRIATAWDLVEKHEDWPAHA